MSQTRHTEGYSSSARAAFGRWTLLTCAAVAILTATLAPASEDSAESVFACVFCGDRALADAVANVLLYLPLGIGLALVGVRTRYLLLLGACLSATIETVQVVLPGRDASLGDVIANTSGILFGGLIVHSSPLWLHPTRQASTRYCAAALAFAIAVFSVSSYLLTPSYPSRAYSVGWTPAEEGTPRYGGTVVQASIGDMSLRPQRIEEPDALRNLLGQGARVQATVIAGPPPAKSTAIILVRDDRRREIFTLGADRDHFIVSYHTRAADFLLDQPDLRVRWGPSVAVGDSLRLATWRSTGGQCLEVNEIAACRLGFSLGSAWSLVLYPESFPGWIKRLLSAAWIAGFAGLVAFWARTPLTTATSIFVIGLSLVVVPSVSTLVGTPLVEWIAAALGVAAGLALQRVDPSALALQSHRAETSQSVPTRR